MRVRAKPLSTDLTDSDQQILAFVLNYKLLKQECEEFSQVNVAEEPI